MYIAKRDVLQLSTFALFLILAFPNTLAFASQYWCDRKDRNIVHVRHILQASGQGLM